MAGGTVRPGIQRLNDEERMERQQAEAEAQAHRDWMFQLEGREYDPALDDFSIEGE
jgi:hypothetical protein